MTRVLVVDDNSDVRTALRSMLEATGFDVDDAADGSLVAGRLTNHPVDVVLTDIVMPEGDGLTLINELAQKPPPRPAVIAMTGQTYLAYEASLEAARALGADAVLVKPFSDSELRTLIQRLIGGSQTLLQDPRRRDSGPGPRERRRHRRTPEEGQATSLIQGILRDSRAASATIESDLRAGTDPKTVSALLQTAAVLALSRGIDIRLHIQQVRLQLQEAGFPV